MTSFQLDIVTPEKIAYAGHVEMVTVHSSTGVIGILAHHVPLFSRLIEGELVIRKGKEETYFAIGGGFVHVTTEKVTILVTSASHADEINEAEVLSAKKRAEEALKGKSADVELIEAEAAFRRSVIALKVLHHKRGRRISPTVS